MHRVNDVIGRVFKRTGWYRNIYIDDLHPQMHFDTNFNNGNIDARRVFLA